VKKSILYSAIMAVWAVSGVAHADQIADLKAEIAAQRKAAEAQQARLDALEQKLTGVQQTQAAAAAQPAQAGGGNGVNVAFEQGKGLTVQGSQGYASLYGLIDITYVHTNNADKGGSSVTSPRVAWFSGNRWGLTGARNLGNTGMDVIFRLESEFESQTGDMDTPGTLFNRDAWVGVQSKDLGKLTFGRQNALARDPIASGLYGDPYGSAKPTLDEGGYTNNNNFKQLVFYAGSATGTRVDNGIVWKKSFDSGLYVGAQYQFGGVPGSFSTGSTETVSLAYAGGKFNVAGYVTSANVNGYRNRAYSVGGNYLLTDDMRVNGGVFHYTANQGSLGNRSDNAYTVSASWRPNKAAWDYALGYVNMKANNAAVNGGGNVINAFGNVASSTAVATGSRSTVYGSVMYHFDKFTEVYVATDYLKLKDGYRVSATNGAKSQVEVAVGMRTRF
jgi:predicted porin/uncharacterized coiled-coil protein SlyX